MPIADAPPPSPSVTVEQAIARGNARERLRTARGIRATGTAMLVGGIYVLTRGRSWYIDQAIGVHVHGGPSFTLSFAALAGAIAVIISPVVIAWGQWLVNRETTAARNDPMLATILTEPED